MATIFEDFFTDTDGVDLPDHTPDTGSGWGAVLGAATNMDIQSNEANTALQNTGHATTGLTENDYKVFCNLLVVATAERTGILARVTDEDNYIGTRIKPAGDEFRMDKRIASTVSTVATSTSDTIDANTFYTIRLDAQDTGASQNFDGYFAGTLRLNPSAPNDSVLNDGEPGVGWPSGGAGADHRHDAFRVEDFPAAATYLPKAAGPGPIF